MNTKNTSDAKWYCTRVSYERDKALREGTPLSEVRPAFEDKANIAS